MPFVLVYKNKHMRVRPCPVCEGKGFIIYPTFGMLCMRRCHGGLLVDYPWERGRSLTPILPLS